jgi:hypothetical protein
MSSTRAKWAAVAFVVAGWSFQASARADVTFNWWNRQPQEALYGRGHMAMASDTNILLISHYSQTLTKLSASDGSVLWDVDIFNIVPGTNFNASGHVIVDISGNAYVSGYINDPVNNRAIVGVRKISPAGAILWTGQYDVGFSTENSGGGPMAVGWKNDNLYVLGHAGPQSSNVVPVTLLHISRATGVEKGRFSMGTSTQWGEGLQDWRVSVDLFGSSVYVSTLASFIRFPANIASTTWSYPKAVRSHVAVNPYVYVTGTEQGPSGWHMFVAKLLTVNGSQAWKTTFYDHPRPAYPGSPNLQFNPSNSTTYGGNAVRLGSDGVYVTGTAAYEFWDGAMAAKLDTTTGAVMWTREIGYGSVDSTCFDGILDSSDRFYVSCTSKQQADFGSTAIAMVYNSLGTDLVSLWTEGPGGADDGFERLMLGASGAIYMLEEAGTWNPGYTSQHFVPWIFKYTITGL